MSASCPFCIDLLGFAHETSYATRARHMHEWILRQNLNPIFYRVNNAVAPDVAMLLQEQEQERQFELDMEAENELTGDNLDGILRGNPATQNSGDADTSAGPDDIDFRSGKLTEALNITAKSNTSGLSKQGILLVKDPVLRVRLRFAFYYCPILPWTDPWLIFFSGRILYI